jgi:hypothetical protein
MKIEDPNERTWLKGLAVECPFGEALPSCPLNGLRNLPTLQIKHIIGRMSDRQIHTAIETHRQCYKERLEDLQEAEHHTLRHHASTA